MHVLQLCPRVPFPPHDGGAIAMYDVAAGLARAGHKVTVLAVNTPKHFQPDTALDHLGPNVRLVTVPVDTRLRPVRALRNLLLGSIPYNVERFVSTALAEQLTQILQTETIDVVQVEGTFVAWYIDTIRRVAPHVPVVLRAHNVEHTIWQMLASREYNVAKAWYLRHLARRLEQFERQYLPRFDAVAAITEPDRRRLLALGCPEPVVFVPAGVDADRLPLDPTLSPRPRTAFIIGSLDWLPNREGVEWFLTNIWPQVHEQLPKLELHLAGKSTPPAIQQHHGRDNIYVHGFVESAAQFMQQYELMLVPLLSGGGMRIKIIEGMALGKCILSTGLGSEGIAVQEGHDILLCDEPQVWVARLRAYYEGTLPYQQIRQEARRTIARLYDNRRVIERFLQLYSCLGRLRESA
ncbi:glycosyltransferase family 4 protein [Hymenobacter aerilatus]|uniref:Glycosyltransferase family 4 protein n=1 Tax=Hymenobacter aerilatus TaxID=2932251 RepID=A0A8T9SWC6_9BACT|nr:glycosyltransferase family 4 protein [Hymenobacter aerilatus]UOR06512.1 glycosyltransferase family 4 protein [Hymenobacter aerilatus]